MFRALLDLIVVFIVVMAARAILGSVMKGFANAARSGFAQQAQAPPTEPPPQTSRERVAGELHKDPVCGMYVAESTQYQRRSGRETFYYCSQKCKEQDSVAARA